MKNSKHVTRENIVNTLELPKDLLLGMPYISLCGNRELLLENHRGFLTYSETQMVILCKHFQIEINGKGLYVEYYTADSMKIQGQMEQILFHL